MLDGQLIPLRCGLPTTVHPFLQILLPSWGACRNHTTDRPAFLFIYTTAPSEKGQCAFPTLPTSALLLDISVSLIPQLILYFLSVQQSLREETFTMAAIPDDLYHFYPLPQKYKSGPFTVESPGYEPVAGETIPRRNLKVAEGLVNIPEE